MGYVQLELDVPLELPFTVVRGAQAGPTLLVTAGIHGAEYASIEAAVRVARTDPKDLSGTLVVLPITNPPAYKARSIYINPIDGQNLNRQFPGDPDGSFSQQLAAWLTENAIQASSAFIDLHGGDMIEALTPFTIFTEGDASAQQLAEAFGIPLLVSSAPGGMSISAGFKHGVPSILAEAGGNGLWPEHDVQWLEQGVKRVMQHLSMIVGTPEPMPTRLLTQFAWLRAEHDGLWYPTLKAGETVRAGQDLGRITDPFGVMLQEIAAPQDGVVLFAVTSLAINHGDPLYGIGA
jgi:predicted deacylase